MSDAPTTAVLREEHRLILQVVDRLDRAVGSGGVVSDGDLELARDCVAFFKLFVDACHHAKEEDLLFPALEEQGMPHDAGPIAVMLEEHRLGRELVGRMARALEDENTDAARAELGRAARDYIALIRQHIGKEDGVLFTMADRMVTPKACQRLLEAYGRADACAFDRRTKAQLETLAASITARG